MCDHPEYYLIEDLRSGDRVCIKCAIVIDRLSTNTKCKIEESNDVDHVKEQATREFIIDVCEILHIRTTFLVDTAYNIFKQMNGRNASFNSHERAKASFAIWEALNRQGTPRCPHSIAKQCSISPKSMLLIEKRYQMDYPITDAVSYVDRICAFLNIPYAVTRMIKEIVKELQTNFQARHPETLITAVLIKCVSMSPDLEFLSLDSEKICNELGVKMKTAKSLCKKLPPYRIFYDDRKKIQFERMDI